MLRTMAEQRSIEDLQWNYVSTRSLLAGENELLLVE
jgi:hypothetical protein